MVSYDQLYSPSGRQYKVIKREKN